MYIFGLVVTYVLKQLGKGLPTDLMPIIADNFRSLHLQKGVRYPSFLFSTNLDCQTFCKYFNFFTDDNI